MRPEPTRRVEDYLERLGRELRKHGLAEARIVEEVRGHLADAIDDSVGQGLPPEESEREALARFGAPEAVAAQFAAERDRGRDRWLLAAAAVVGALIAFVNSRPTWDDAGITALAMFLAAQVFGLISPRRPWLWAIAVGIWIPALAVVRTSSVGSLTMLVVLAFPLLGAYLGSAIRRASPRFGSLFWLREPLEPHFALHDRPAPGYHVRAKAAALRNLPRSSNAAPNEFDAREQLLQFLNTVQRADNALGHLGAVESLTLVEETTDSRRHARKYLAVFANGARTTFTIVHASDGRVLSIDGTNAP
jgi:hypothetical protein